MYGASKQIDGPSAFVIRHLRWCRALPTVRVEWDATCDEASLSDVDRKVLWERIFLNPYIFEGGEGF
jgi:hypothetical protein